MRRAELDKVRRAQMRWSVGREECSVKCGAWRVQCGAWSVKFGVWRVQWERAWRVQCEVWNVKREVWTVKFEVWSAKSAVWSVKCGVLRVQCEVKCWLRRVQCEERSVKCEDCQVWSVTWSFKCDMWNKTPVSQSARTHGLGWRTAHASFIDEKGLIYIYIYIYISLSLFKATSAPPRAGTTGIVLHVFNTYICILISRYFICLYIYIFFFILI